MYLDLLCIPRTETIEQYSIVLLFINHYQYNPF
jgi:hypothetical protein